MPAPASALAPSNGAHPAHPAPASAARAMDPAAAQKALSEVMKPKTPASAWRALLRKAGGLDTLDALLKDAAGAAEDPAALGAGDVASAGSIAPRSTVYSLMMAAALHDDESAIEHLIDKAGANAHRAAQARDGDGWSALHWAAAFSQPSIVRRLAEVGHAQATEDTCQWTPLMVAAMQNRVANVEALLPFSDLAARDRDGHSALALASLFATTALAPLLVAERAERALRETVAPTMRSTPVGDDTTPAHHEHDAVVRGRIAQSERFAHALLCAHVEENKESTARLVETLAAELPRAAAGAGEAAAGVNVARNFAPTPRHSLASDVLTALALDEVPNADDAMEVGVDEAIAIAAQERSAAIIQDVMARLVDHASSAPDAASALAGSDANGEPTDALAARREAVMGWRDEAAATVLSAISGASVSELLALAALLTAAPASQAQAELRASAKAGLAGVAGFAVLLRGSNGLRSEGLQWPRALQVPRTTKGSKRRGAKSKAKAGGRSKTARKGNTGR